MVVVSFQIYCSILTSTIDHFYHVKGVTKIPWFSYSWASTSSVTAIRALIKAHMTVPSTRPWRSWLLACSLTCTRPQLSQPSRGTLSTWRALAKESQVRTAIASVFLLQRKLRHLILTAPVHNIRHHRFDIVILQTIPTHSRHTPHVICLSPNFSCYWLYLPRLPEARCGMLGEPEKAYW